MLEPYLAGPPRDASATALIAAMAVRPSGARINQVHRAVRALKAAGVWSQLDALYVLAAHDSQAACLNWVAPGTFTLSPQSSPAFAADRGYTGNGSSAYLDCQFNRQTAGLKFTQNSASMGAWVRSSGANDNGDCGVSTASGNPCRILSRPVGDSMHARLNDTTNLSFTVATAAGFTAGNRSAAGARQLYKNGAAVGSDTTASGALNGDNFRILGAGAGFTDHQVAAAVFGGSLTAAQHAALYAALLAYMQAAGAA